MQQAYSNIEVNPSVKIIKPYHKTDKRENERKKSEGKKREDRQLCTLYFCQEVGCSASFESVEELEDHEVKGDHVVPTELSNMDKVKKMFVQKMKGKFKTYYQPLTAEEK